MNKFVDEEYHFYGDFEFLITDNDIEKLKQGKALYGDVNDEFSIQLKYVGEGENEDGRTDKHI